MCKTQSIIIVIMDYRGDEDKQMLGTCLLD